MGYTVGTFTLTGAAQLWSMDKAAADNTSVILIPITPPQNSEGLKGSYLKSVTLWWTNGVADLDALSAAIYKATLPAQGAAMAAPAAQTFTYDAAHDLAAERITQDEHKMTLTITTPFWMDDDDEVFIELTVDAAVGSIFKMFAARAEFTLRL